LVSLAERESRIANFLLMTTQLELRRMQEHSLLVSRDAKGRLASFLIDLSERMGTQTWLDLPMSHLDIADPLGLTIETLSRIITQMENSGVIVRGRSRRLFLNNRQARRIEIFCTRVMPFSNSALAAQLPARASAQT
jgi:CRP/FNR family nitrogen fixation transcriptional regulator